MPHPNIDKANILIPLIQHQLTSLKGALTRHAIPLALALIARIRVDLEQLKSYIEDT